MQNRSFTMNIHVPNLPFHEILNNRGQREEFRAFVETKGAIETLLLYDCILLFEQAVDTNASSGKSFTNTIGRKIVTFFIMEGSQYQVDLSDVIKSPLVAMAEDGLDFHPTCFDQVKEEVTLMLEENYHMFLLHVAKQEKDSRRLFAKLKIRWTVFQSIFGMIRGRRKPKEPIYMQHQRKRNSSYEGAIMDTSEHSLTVTS